MNATWQAARFGGGLFLPQVRMAGPSRRYRMGQTPVEWYQRAKVAMARFEDLLARANGVANATERGNILTWVGEASNPATPAYRYATVKSDVTLDVEAFTPPNYNAYQLTRRQNRVEELEELNSEFNDRVENAERVYGVLPPAQVIERERVVTVPGQGPDLTVPILVGAGALILALVL